jgi:ankyrin repeat protein
MTSSKNWMSANVILAISIVCGVLASSIVLGQPAKAGAQGAAKTEATQSTTAKPTPDPASLADAVLARDLDQVRRLVAQGADIHGLDVRPQTAGSNGRRPLNFAALQNDTKMIELLLELGADINRQNLTGFTPLHHAVEAQALEAIALLLKRGADTSVENKRGLTPGDFALATHRRRAAEALGVSVRAE